MGLIGLTLLSVTNLSAQYVAQFLPPPPDLPGYTDAYALNNNGQVFGRAGVISPPARGPVLWTDGIPADLPVPSGYHWADIAGVHFINDSGTVVSTVTLDVGGGTRPIVWQNGGLPTVLAPCDVGPDGSILPLGLNSGGDILVLACDQLWIYIEDQPYLYSSPPDPIPGCIGLDYHFFLVGNRLNDFDHLSGDLIYYVDQGCPLPGWQVGIFYPNAFPPPPYIFGPLATTSYSGQINNFDQFVIWNTGPSHVWLWDGSEVVDIGLGGYASLNNLGQVLFYSTGPMLYSDGVVSPITLPPEAAGTLTTLLNDVGQIAGTQPGFNSRAVLLTPSGAPNVRAARRRSKP